MPSSVRSLGRMVAVALSVAAAPATATTILSTAADFLPSYTGPQAGDVDVLSATAQYGGGVFRLSSRQNGAIGTTAGALYVWGVNRGGNTAHFGGFAPRVLFDSVVLARPDGTGAVVVFTPGGPVATPLAVGAVTINGSRIAVRVPFSLLPSNGFQPVTYGFNLWPRVGLGSNDQISEFVPDEGTFTASFVPEPAVWASMLIGFGLLGSALRHRRTRYVSA